MSNNLQTIDNATGEVVSFRAEFKRMEGEVTAALPPHIPPERFMRVVLTAVNMTPDLLHADRASLLGSCMKAAQDGLLPDGRDGALVMFKTKLKVRGQADQWIDKVQWMPMIGGILKKVRNSGELLSIAAHVVYKQDEFFYKLGDEERIEHTPFLDGDAGPPRLVYAIAKTKDGGIYREVMTIAQVEKVRAISKAGKNEYGPWAQWWDEMAKKTVMKRMAKRLPTSADLDDLLRRDDDLYDFKGNRDKDDAPAIGFEPAKNPLKDKAPEIEDKTAGTTEQKGPTINPEDRFNGDAKDFATADFVISRSGKILKDRHETPAFIIDQRYGAGENGKGDIFEDYQEWLDTCADNKFATELGQDWKAPEQGSGDGDQADDGQSDETAGEAAGEGSKEAAPEQRQAETSSPSKPAASRAGAQAPKGVAFDGSDGYLTHMRDLFDTATSKSAITEEWSKTRDDRKELLSIDETAALTKDRDEALKRFAR